MLCRGLAVKNPAGARKAYEGSDVTDSKGSLDRIDHELTRLIKILTKGVQVQQAAQRETLARLDRIEAALGIDENLSN